MLRKGGRQSSADNLEVAKVSLITGKYQENEIVLRNHELHRRHDERFGYKHFVLTQPVIGGFWDRTVYMLSLITLELAKPENERLQWMMWYDADVTLMNPNTPLEAFLPPQDQWSHIHMLVTNDDNGLNNGVFFLRVHPWSIQLLKTVIGIEMYEGDVDLEYSEQTALELWILSDSFREHVMHVPQRWFNAKPTEWEVKMEGGSVSAELPDKELHKATLRQGDLFVHFAGLAHKTRAMEAFMMIAEEARSDWELEFEGSELQTELISFWSGDALEEDLIVDDLITEMQQRRLYRKKHGIHATGGTGF
ncbi:hypothetical protein BDZ85DRAFT_204661 [Elsinoe ampelina]|uniref:Galactosyl transferase GMA12/MNN10 family-domain-containing protein n=1 Tax=Elsinoe ampelina TaxID=302913 RepID=A0A6A6G3M5_9PEZI|nr:hypothetical protein BDZ85DRAFT_204661 [Elsinoe ampelina]